jgi:hypothetical protein
MFENQIAFLLDLVLFALKRLKDELAVGTWPVLKYYIHQLLSFELL